jgi:hypothetical protein
MYSNNVTNNNCYNNWFSQFHYDNKYPVAGPSNQVNQPINYQFVNEDEDGNSAPIVDYQFVNENGNPAPREKRKYTKKNPPNPVNNLININNSNTYNCTYNIYVNQNRTNDNSINNLESNNETNSNIEQDDKETRINKMSLSYILN